MKYALSFLCLLLFKVGFSQQKSIAGVYVSKDNYIILTDSTLKFKTEWGCCFTTTLYGYGSYTLENNTIHYNPDIKANTLQPNYKVIENLIAASKTIIQIKDSNEYIPYCEIVLWEKRRDKLIERFISDSNGIVVTENIDSKKFEEIVVKPILLGYGKIEIPLHEISGKSVVLDLANARNRNTAYHPATFTLEEHNDTMQIIGPVFRSTEPLSKEENKHKRKLTKGIMIREWPWNWHFKSNHTPVPTIFMKQPKTI